MTVGHDQVIAIGDWLQFVVVIYSLTTIPMFFDFLSFVAELLRSQVAACYNRCSTKLRPTTKDQKRAVE